MLGRMGWSSCAVAVAAWLAPATASAEGGTDAALRVELDAYLTGALADFEVPGAALAVVHHGAPVYLRGVGLRDVASGEPVGEATRFAIGSLTKAMTSTLAATLVDDGLLGWDDPVVELLPGFSVSDGVSAPRVTMRHLFTHSSGVQRNDVILFIEAPSPLELVESVREFPVLAAPGDVFEYSNQVYSIGGFAAARAAGARLGGLRRGFRRAMQRRVFDRIGMSRTTLDFDTAVNDSDHATPYAYSLLDRELVSPLEFERFTTPIAPAGGVWSSIADMARFLQVHLAEGLTPEGSRVVSAESLLETHRAQIAVPGFAGGGYGFGWGVLSSGGVTQILHDGSALGFTARIVGVPEQDWGFVILVNRGDATPFLDAVTGRVTAILSNAERPDDDPLVARDQAQRAALDAAFDASLPVSPEQAAPYLGAYERAIRVSSGDGLLLIDTVYGVRPFRAVAGRNDRFVSVGLIQERMLAEFLAEPDGGVVLRFGYPTSDGQLPGLVQVERLERDECPNASR